MGHRGGGPHERLVDEGKGGRTGDVQGSGDGHPAEETATLSTQGCRGVGGSVCLLAAPAVAEGAI